MGDKRKQLEFLLQQSGIYSQVIGDKMARERAERVKEEAKASKKAPTGKAKAAPSRKRKASQLKDVIAEDELEEVAQQAAEGASATGPGTKQSRLVTGATLKDYQLDGVEWLLSLYANGLSGILADEMGLGKTIQTIAFLAHLRENGVFGAVLVVCPLSTLANWVNEFERFTPDIPVILYHGTPDERAAMREEQLGLPATTKGKGKKPARSVGRKNVKADGEGFPIIITSYELVMNDRVYLSKIDFKYIIVDESHRLKNLNCKLIKELKEYKSASRLLLTGTPLHNNLAELWSLLNYILPDIFEDLDAFQQWFDFSDIQNQSGHERILSQEQSEQIVTKLHAILKPFLLRRLKKDVEKDLPPKKEYLLHAPMTSQQKEIYDAIVNKSIRSFLIDRKTGEDGSSRGSTPGSMISMGSVDSSPSTDTESAPIAHSTRRRSKKRARLSYEEKSDEQFFDDVESGVNTQDDDDELSMDQRSRAFQQKTARKSVNGLKLQNLVMQLRKVCDHPWLFDWPIDPTTGQQMMNEDLVNASGKMLMLNKLLTELFARGHKVLLFSQFTSMLDIIQDWAEEYKQWPVCRIDGSTKQDDRRAQMKAFNDDKSTSAPNLFLLSTRAGGVGINLVSADTVILFDSDWNPQMDLQAQDRAHRIGQTRPVLVFRLISANSIENQILAKAGAKRKLEALVIGEGAFRMPGAEVSDILTGGKRKTDKGNLARLAEALLTQEGEEVQLASKDDEIISKEQLDRLLDRSDEAMSRTTGWKDKEVAGVEVFSSETQEAEGDETLARLLAA